MSHSKLKIWHCLQDNWMLTWESWQWTWFLSQDCISSWWALPLSHLVAVSSTEPWVCPSWLSKCGMPKTWCALPTLDMDATSLLLQSSEAACPPRRCVLLILQTHMTQKIQQENRFPSWNSMIKSVWDVWFSQHSFLYIILEGKKWPCQGILDLCRASLESCYTREGVWFLLGFNFKCSVSLADKTGSNDHLYEYQDSHSL